MAYILPLLLLGLVLRASIIRIPRGESGLHERLGRNIGVMAPGFHLIVPFIDRVTIHRMSETGQIVKLQGIEASLSYKVTDLKRLRENISDLPAAFRAACESRLKALLKTETFNGLSAIDLKNAEVPLMRDLKDIFIEWGVEIQNTALKKS